MSTTSETCVKESYFGIIYAFSRYPSTQKYLILACVNAILCSMHCVGLFVPKWKVILLCTSQIICYQFQNLNLSFCSIYFLVPYSAMCFTRVWNVEIIH